MEKENIEISYDKEENIISLFKAGAGVKFSFDISLPNGDVVIDYGFNGLIVGMEFFNASDYFPILNKIKDVKKLKAVMNVRYGPNWAQIAYALYSSEMKEPIVSFINAPYSKKLILKN